VGPEPGTWWLRAFLVLQFHSVLWFVGWWHERGVRSCGDEEMRALGYTRCCEVQMRVLSLAMYQHTGLVVMIVSVRSLWYRMFSMVLSASTRPVSVPSQRMLFLHKFTQLPVSFLPLKFGQLFGLTPEH